MLSAPLYFFLFLFFLFLAVFVAFCLMIIYHIVVSASFSWASFFMAFFIFSISALTLYLTFELLGEVDWRLPVFTIDFSEIIDIFT